MHLFTRDKSCNNLHVSFSRMKLTRYTDYALRVLMHLAVQARPAGLDRRASRALIASPTIILMKVVQDLRMEGFVDAVRGRHRRHPARASCHGEFASARSCDTPSAASTWSIAAAASIAPACALTGGPARALRPSWRCSTAIRLADLGRRAGGGPAPLWLLRPRPPPAEAA